MSYQLYRNTTLGHTLQESLDELIQVWVMVPGQFAPRSESANRTLANSLPGPFAPWNFRFQERNGRPFRSRERKFFLPFAPWNFGSHNDVRQVGCIFAHWHIRTFEYANVPICECANMRICVCCTFACIFAYSHIRL